LSKASLSRRGKDSTSERSRKNGRARELRRKGKEERSETTGNIIIGENSR